MNNSNLLKLKEKLLLLDNIRDASNLLPNMTAYEYLYDCNKDRLDKIAINYLGRIITFEELFKKIDVTAKAYSELGIKDGDFVSMSMLMTPEAVISFYALNKIGAAVNMVNIAYSKETIRNELNDTKSKMFITMNIFYDREMRDAIHNSTVENVVNCSLNDSLPKCFSDNLKFLVVEKIKNNRSIINNDNLCKSWSEIQKIGSNSKKVVNSFYVQNKPSAIAYTSGSTGEPKAVLTGNKQLNSIPIQMAMTDKSFKKDDSIFNTLPIWIYYSLVNNTHEPLCLGVTIDMDPIFDSKKVIKRIKQYKFNHWNTIPSYVEDMVNSKRIEKMNLSHIKSITTGGDYLSPNLQSKGNELLKKCNSEAYIGQGYGASELLGSFSYTYDKNSTIGSVGKPLVGNHYKIIDLDTNKILGVNKIGELYLYSPSMMLEYYHNPKATKDALISDANGVVWYRTGDLAHYNETHELFIDGRIRRVVIAKDDNGFPTKIFPDKIKQCIAKNSFVDKCEIITVDDPEHISKPIAYIVLKDGVVDNEKATEDIKKECSMYLENYTCPSEYNILKDIPLKPSLKPDIEALEKKYIEDHSSEKNIIKSKKYEKSN